MGFAVVDWDRVKARSRSAGRKRALWGAIRMYCLECLGSASAVRDCPAPHCELYLYRLGFWGVRKQENGRLRLEYRTISIRRAIRRNCIECVGTSKDICTADRCPLYPYRLG